MPRYVSSRIQENKKERDQTRGGRPGMTAAMPSLAPYEYSYTIRVTEYEYLRILSAHMYKTWRRMCVPAHFALDNSYAHVRGHVRSRTWVCVPCVYYFYGRVSSSDWSPPRPSPPGPLPDEPPSSGIHVATQIKMAHVAGDVLRRPYAAGLGPPSLPALYGVDVSCIAVPSGLQR